jgi:pyridoxal phosphate enzyme (YggS family)
VGELEQRLAEVKGRIAMAAQTAGRDPGEIRLVVVTKGHPAEMIHSLHQLGVRDIGESYVQEGIEKKETLGTLDGLVWHMIGHVQSRKADDAVKHFDRIHSVDSLKLAGRLDRSVDEANRSFPILLECNVSGESSKYGFPAWDKDQWTNVLPEVEKILKLPNIEVHGLMSMAPYLDDPEKARPYFAQTRNLRNFLAQRFPQADWSQLSMGMSGDFEAAIKEGATILRIGTAILGERPKI